MSKTPRGPFWFETGLVFLVFFIAGADPAPMVNESHYLCRLKHFWVEPYCTGDLFLESPDAHFTVVWLFGWVTQFVSLETTAWIGRLLSWTVLAIGWRRLVGRLTPTPLMAPLGAALLLFGTRQCHLAGEWVVGGFEAKSVAYGFVLLALADAIDSRWNRAWVLLGVAAAFHALVGGWSVVALLLVAAFHAQRPSLASMAPGLAVGGLLSLFGVAPAIAMNVGVPPEIVSEANQTYVFFRLPHHLALRTMPAEWLSERALRHSLIVAALAILSLLRVTRDRPDLRLVAGFAWGAEAISLAGFAIELIGRDDPAWAASLLRYYWFRLADIATPIAVALLLVDWVGEGLTQRRKLAVAAATLLLCVSGWHLTGPAWKRTQSPHSAGDAKMLDPAAWIEACDWIKQNTPKDAVFLVPRQSLSFKWRAERAEVATHKDIPQDARSMVEWRRRYLDVFQVGQWPDGSPRWTPSLSSLGAARLRELGDKYGATYVLSQAPRRDAARGMPLRRRASLPIVHQAGPYTVYSLTPGR